MKRTIWGLGMCGLTLLAFLGTTSLASAGPDPVGFRNDYNSARFSNDTALSGPLVHFGVSF